MASDLMVLSVIGPTVITQPDMHGALA